VWIHRSDGFTAHANMDFRRFHELRQLVCEAHLQLTWSPQGSRNRTQKRNPYTQPSVCTFASLDRSGSPATEISSHRQDLSGKSHRSGLDAGLVQQKALQEAPQSERRIVRKAHHTPATFYSLRYAINVLPLLADYKEQVFSYLAINLIEALIEAFGDVAGASRG
jgi:hypothetical protein